MSADLLTEYDINFEIDRLEFSKILRQVNSVIPASNSFPDLVNFNIQADADRNTVKVLGSDLNTVMTCTYKSAAVHSSGHILIPAKKLLPIIAEADNGRVIIKAYDGKAYIAADSNLGVSRWEIATGRIDRYPKLDSKAVLSVIPRHEFLTALRCVRVAASRDATLTSRTIISFASNKVTACDGARLHQFSLSFNLPFEFSLSVFDTDLLIRSIETGGERLAIGENKKFLFFASKEDLSLMIAKTTSKLPNVERILLRPALENKQEWLVNREELIAGIKKVRITADQETQAMTVKLNSGTVSLESKDKFGNNATFSFNTVWSGNTELTVNWKHFIDMLTSFTSNKCTVLLGDNDKLKKTALLIKDEELGLTTLLQQLVLE